MGRKKTKINKEKSVSQLVPMARVFNQHLMDYITNERHRDTIDTEEFKEFCRIMASTLSLSCSSILCESNDVVPFSGKMYGDLISTLEECFKQLPD